MLTAIGDLVEDVVVRLQGPPRSGTDTPAAISRHRGGSAANVAVAAVRSGLGARFVGQVGGDALGDLLLDDLRRSGVEAAVERGGRTGSIVVVVVPSGERSFLTDRGAATGLAVVRPEWLDGAQVLHVPAYSFAGEPLARTTARLIQLAHDRDVPVTLDTSSVAVIEELGVEATRTAIERSRPRVLFATEAEADLLALPGWRPAAVEVVIVKRGAAPTTVVTAAGRHEVPAAAAEVVDTTGAGDAFAAGFLAAWLDRADPVTAAQRGHELAGLAVARPGAGIAEASL
ncbi:MAG: carbohydrate kinase family protein [Nitriliruptorales bacterium]